jgi:TM2 domain-containing membrane protein YozV
MKKPFVALLLSILLPGAGLAYLGRWKWGLINLAVVLAVGVGMAYLLSDDVFDRISTGVAAGLAGGSGALARQLAIQINAKAEVSGKT